MCRSLLVSGWPLIILPLLCGCIQYNESFQFDEKGRGVAGIVLSHPRPGDKAAKILAAEFDRRFSREALSRNLPAGITLDYQRSDADAIEVRAAYHFDNVNALIAWAAANDSPLGNISIVQKDGLFEFTRHFPADSKAFESARATTPAGTIRFILTGPGDLLKNNATRTDGNAAIWEFTAPTLFDSGGKIMAAQYLPVKMNWIYPSLALIFVGVMTAIWMRSRPRRPVS